ncbi:21435_t:CDS:2 [Cetraspora pellucida]|uniref:21435_t:CDS:1 n=1 Tax=Cetraspora pellucida TaxID=1433469 RepID=A0A9N9JSH0_9GLOM|nr:21435_t:CDS:2 [Cetraspora pellucida]
MQTANLNLFYPPISKEIMDLKLKVDIDTLDTSSRNNNISNQPEIIVLSDSDNEPVLESTSNSFIRYYEDLQISSSSESEYGSDNSLNDCVSMDNLNDNNIIGNSLKDEDIYEDLNDNDILKTEYLKISLMGITSVYNVLGWNHDNAKKNV